MKDGKKFARIMAILLAVLLLITFIVPAFAMFAYADEPGNETEKSEIAQIDENTAGNAVEPIIADSTKDVFIISLSVEENGVLVQGENGKKVKITVSDQRVIVNDDTINLGVNVSAPYGAFASDTPIVNYVSREESGLIYTIEFPNCRYLGGTPEFSFSVNYTANGTEIAVPLVSLSHTISQVAVPTPTPAPTAEPTPTPTPAPTATPAPKDVDVDVSKDVFIQSYKVSDKATGKEVTVVNPGQTVKLRFNVIDNRVTYLSNAPTMRARMSQGAFKNNDHGDVKYELMNVGTVNGRKILAYQVTFDNVVYQGGSQDTAFDISYTDYNTGSPVTVPYTELKQVITQAVDDIPEPKVILNSANYGGAAYIDKAFTLATVATNISEYMELENVSVRVELPAGVAVADGNSQALIGKVAKGGTISHNFKLIITGVENNVTSLPVNVVYEYEAFVKGARKTYTNQHSVAINIEQETKFEISKLEHMEAITAGEEDCITVYLLNKGKTSANNVTIEVVGDKLNGPQTVFAGNIVPGTESIQDIYFTVNETGVFNGKVVVTYENTKGKQSTIEKEFTMEVMEAYNYEWDEPVFEEPVITEQTSETPWIAIGAAAAVIVVATAVIVAKKRKAKKNAEDEDEDI